MFRTLVVLAGLSALLALAACSSTNTASTPDTGTTTPAGPATIAISVTEDGFVPANVEVRAGEPVTLVVTRKTTKTCATEFVMKEHNINQPLPLDQPVEIRFTPAAAGDLHYACAMDMIKGVVVAK